MLVDFERHCAEIVAQTALLTGYLDGADLKVQVSTCPGWNASQLLRHVDGGHRWAAEIVSTRAVSPPPDVALRDLSGYTDEDPTLLAASLTDGASLLAAALREAGPKAQMWCPVDGGGAAFYARRFAHETAIHRADAALALGTRFVIDGDFAATVSMSGLNLVVSLFISRFTRRCVSYSGRAASSACGPPIRTGPGCWT
jgi:uncharacterized protein (TIGR03083 family)